MYFHSNIWMYPVDIKIKIDIYRQLIIRWNVWEA